MDNENLENQIPPVSEAPPDDQSDKRKILRLVIIVLAGIILFGLLASFAAVRFAISRISYEPDDTEAVTIDPHYAAGQGILFPDREPIHKPGIINVLFLGTDFRISENDRGRADSNMLCSLNTRTGEIKLVSFERGIGVPIPGRGSDLLTHAYNYGGPALSQSIISQMFCVEIQGYAQVDFGTFADIIDAIGGITVDLTELEAKALNGAVPANVWSSVEVHEGLNHLNGHDTLEYCRLRAIDSDWDRQRRQRTALTQIQKACRDLSFRELVQLADDVLPMIHTNLSQKEVVHLLRCLPKLMRGSVSQLQVPDQNHTYSYIRCVTDYESKKIANFLYDAGYEISSPY